MNRAALVALFLIVPSLSFGQEDVIPPNVIVIDGAKNPEQIPEHRVWRSIFQTFAEGVQLMPNGVAEYVTPAETTLILAEAKKLQNYWTTCGERAAKVREQLPAFEPTQATWIAKARELDPVMWEIELECRWETLHTRDRIMEQLTVEGQSALRAWAESRKGGMKSVVPKNGLVRYRQPQ